MDARYKPLTDYVIKRFLDHLGDRLQSIFIKGSVAREDAIWGVSDLDLVLAFEQPNKLDNELKREVEASAKNLPAGNALVIQRISDERLQQMSAGTRAYWLYSCYYDSEVLYGKNPKDFLPKPPTGIELSKLLAPIIKQDGEILLSKNTLDRHESRQLAKRILNALSLPSMAQGLAEYIPNLEIAKLEFPHNVKKHIDEVINIYSEAPQIRVTASLINAWKDTWDYIGKSGLI